MTSPRASVFVGTVLVMLVGALEARLNLSAAESSPGVRLLDDEHSRPRSYRATRRLTAANSRFKMSGWVEAFTELDGDGFRYRIVGTGGSEYIQRKVLLPVLAQEERIVSSGEMSRAALESGNYAFEAAEDGEDGLRRIRLSPLRKDPLLVDGAMFVTGDGDLVRVEGRLTKNPSFWTRRVDVVRRYGRINGVRVPIATTSTARVLIAGTSSFAMCYDYERVNDEPVTSRISCE